MENIRLESEWEARLLHLGWSHRAAKQFKFAWAESTLKLYNRLVNKLVNYTTLNHIQFPLTMNDSAMCAEFLCQLSDQSDRPASLLKSTLAALSCFYDSRDLENPFKDKIIQQLVSALVKSGSRVPSKRTPVMPLNHFLELFRTWPENEKLSIAELRLKAITLFTIVLMARPSDLAPKGIHFDSVNCTSSMVEFTTDQLVFNTDGSMTVNVFAVKNDTDRSGFEVCIPAGSDYKTDPVATIKCYIDRTAGVRPCNYPVFLSLKAPFQVIKPETVARELQRAIDLTPLKGKGFTPKSFRPSSATAAVQSGISPETAMQIGRWKTQEVFFNHYVYPRAPAAYTDMVTNYQGQDY